MSDKPEEFNPEVEFREWLIKKQIEMPLEVTRLINKYFWELV